MLQMFKDSILTVFMILIFVEERENNCTVVDRLSNDGELEINNRLSWLRSQNWVFGLQLS